MNNPHEEYMKNIANNLDDKLGLVLKDTFNDANSIWIVNHKKGWSDSKRKYDTLTDLINNRLPGYTSKFEIVSAQPGDLKRYE